MNEIKYDKYTKCLQTTYPIAIDAMNKYTTKTFKKYIVNLNSLEEIEEFLKKDRHAYEVLKNTDRKLYIDIDHSNFTASQLDEYIERLNILVCELLNTKDQKLIIMTNETDDLYNSVHIIYPNIVMDYLEMKMLIEYINTTTDLCLDEKVYTKNRLFRFINQSKLKQTKTKKMIFYKNSYPITETFITNITDKPIYTFNKVFKQPQSTTQIKTPAEMIDLFIKRNDDIIFKKSGIWKNITELILKYPYIYSIDEWLKRSSDNYNKYTYEDNLNFIKKIVVDDIKFYNEQYLYVVANTRLKDQPIYYMIKQHDDGKVRTYLQNYFTDNRISDIINFINLPKTNTTNILKITHDEIEYSLDRKTGFITSNDFCINYFYDTIQSTEYPNIIKLQNIEECTNKLNEFIQNNKQKTYILKSSWGTGKTHYVAKPLIKTYLYKKILIITSVNSLNQTNTSELNDYIQSLDEDADLFVSHLEAQKDRNINLKHKKKVVCSIQSLHKLDSNTYDLVIMDEYESVMNAYYGYTTFKHYGIEASYACLNNILTRAKKIIVLDADISEAKVNLLSSFNKETEPLIYKNMTKSFQSIQFNIHSEPTPTNFILHILDEVINQKKLVIPCATRTIAKRILYILGNVMNDNNKLNSTESKYSKLVSEYYNKIKHNNILFISREGCFIYNTDDISHKPTKYTNEEVYSSMDLFLELHKIDIFIYTPTITTGISINKSYFHKCYSIASNNSVVVNEYIQMIMRCRKLIDNETHIFIPYRLFNTHGKQYTTEQIKYNHNARAEMLNELKNNNEELNVQSINKEIEMDLEDEGDNDTNYIELQLINACNLANTKTNFGYNLFNTFKYHNLKYKYNTTNPIIDIESVDMITNEELTQEKQYEDWSNIELLSMGEFIVENMRYETKEHDERVINHKLQVFYEPITDTEEDIARYFKTKHLYLLLNIDKLDIMRLRLIFDCMKDRYLDNVELLYELYNEKSLLDYLDNEINEVIQKYNMRCLWETYFHNSNNKFEVFKIRTFNDPTTTFSINDLTHTEQDVKKIDKMLLKLFCSKIKLDFRDNDKIILTNKEFDKVVKELKQEGDFRLHLYYYAKAHEITGIVEEDQSISPKKDQLLIKEIYGIYKKLLKMIDIKIEYVDKKNTTRQSDKMAIYPYNELVLYPTKPYMGSFNSLDEHKHLKDQSPTYKEDIPILDTKELILLMNKLQHGKKISLKDKTRIMMTLLQNEYSNDYEKIIYRNIKIVLHKYYYNPLHYITLPSDTDKYLYEFWDKNKNKKKEEITLHHREVSTFTKAEDGIYKKGDNKIITRPYPIKEPEITTQTIPNYENEIVADILNTIINNICIKDDLKEKKLEVVDL